MRPALDVPCGGGRELSDPGARKLGAVNVANPEL